MLDHFFEIKENTSYMDDLLELPKQLPKHATIKGHRTNPTETPEMLRQMHIELSGFSIVTHLKHPQEKDKCVTDLGEDENGLSKTLLAKPTNVYILYEMPETITTGPRKGKLSSMNININTQLLEIMLSNRQYCFIFELLYRNFAEEWQVVDTDSGHVRLQIFRSQNF